MIELDAHHHLWSLREGAYAWIRDRLHLPGMARIERDFEAPEFRAVLGRHGVRRSLLVQTERTAEETDQMLRRARACDVIAGVVGWVDFDRIDAAAEVARRAADPLVKGLRVWLLGRDGTDWLFAPHAARGLAAAEEAGLPVELFPGPHQLDATRALIDRHPRLRVAICHAGKPDVGHWDVGGAEFRAWASGMAALGQAGCHVKLSGIVTECGDDWGPEMVRPYWDVLIEHALPARMIWGSDWPVIERAGGYGKWLETVQYLARDLTPGDRDAVFGAAATRFYAL